MISTVKIVLILLLLCIKTVAWSQTFSLSLGNSSTTEAAQCITLYGNDILIGGSKSDSAFVMRLSDSGTPMWIKTFKTSSFSVPLYVNSLDVTSDGYITGTAFGLLSGVCEGYYFKLDASGVPVFLKQCPGYYFQRILEKNTAEYFVFGARYGTGSGGTNMKILTVDKLTGNILAQTDNINFVTSGSFSSTDDLSGSVVLDENNVYTTGRFWHSGSAAGDMRPHLQKYNSNGSIIWTKYLHKNYLSTGRTYPEALLYQSPDHFFIPYFGDETCSGGCTDYYPGLMKLDTNGNVLWDKTYNITGSNGELLRGMVSDGTNFYLMGTTNFNGGGSDFFVIKVDENGNLLKAKSFGSPSANEVLPTSFIRPVYCDSSFIYIAGGTGNDVALLKIDTSLHLACNVNDVFCIVEDYIPFSAPLNFELISETATVSNHTIHNSFIGASPPCILANQTDSIYSTGPVFLDATSSGADAYSWNTGATTPSITVANSGVYTCLISDGCCSFQHIFVVCIQPNATFAVDSTITCQTQVYSFQPNASTAHEFNWYLNDSLISTADLLELNFVSGVYTLELEVSHPACGDSIWRTEQTFVIPDFILDSEFFVPNIFTPNRDGLNDELVLEIAPLENYQLTIFNRWGVEVFSSADIAVSWNGQVNGKPVADGMYAYVLHYSGSCVGEGKVVTGWITVFR